MKISRRQFVAGSSLLLLAKASPTEAKFYLKDGMGGSAYRHGLPILQGRTDQTSTSIIIQHPSRTDVHVAADDETGAPVPVSHYDTFHIPRVKHSVSEYFLQGLSPHKRYQLQVTGDTGEVLDRRNFRSLDIAKKKCRIAMASCMNDSHFFEGIGADATRAWKTLASQRPDLVILTGDTCYADQNLLSLPILNHSKERLAERYFETRSRLAWFRLPDLVPTLAVWDDHDYGTNNGDKSFGLKSDVKFLFNAFWGQRENAVRRSGHGVGSYFEGFGQRFFLMDDRYFRDPEKSKASYWGEKQKDWLLAKLGESRQPAWIVNGNQFFGGYLKKESFEYDYDRDFADFLAGLRKIEAPVAFASGDVHFSEIMSIERPLLGYSTYEFTSSSMHSFSHNGNKKNPRRRFVEESDNFIVFDIDSDSTWKIRARCMRTDGRASFSSDVEIART